MVSYLDFEKSLSEIEGKIRELNEIRLSSKMIIIFQLMIYQSSKKDPKIG